VAFACALTAVSCGDHQLLARAHPAATTAAAATATSTTFATARSTTTTVTTPAPPPTTTAAPAPRHARIAFTGDTMAHTAVSAQGRANGLDEGRAYDFGPMWQLVAPHLTQADLAICHLETTLSTGDTGVAGYPRFRAPRAFAEAIAAAGYDGCSVASNHAFDYGRAGVDDTATVLDESGLRHAGTARSPEEAATPVMYEANGVRVAQLSYAYGLNGLVLPDDEPWRVNLIDVDAILAAAHAAKAAGADIVIVSVHCCVEYRTDPTPEQIDVAQRLLASPDIDLVVGHHAHVVQPIERVGDKYVLYGLGNILSNMTGGGCCPAATRDGVIVDVEFTETAERRFVVSLVTYTPTWVDHAAGFVITPVAEALHDESLPPSTRRELEQSWRRTVDAVDSRGAVDAGVVPRETP
jgi:poly-gamma-glutamate synthesis protein (capsule biosynthesis protein)